MDSWTVWTVGPICTYICVRIEEPAETVQTVQLSRPDLLPHQGGLLRRLFWRSELRRLGGQKRGKREAARQEALSVLRTFWRTWAHPERPAVIRVFGVALMAAATAAAITPKVPLPTLLLPASERWLRMPRCPNDSRSPPSASSPSRSKTSTLRLMATARRRQSGTAIW